MFKFCPNCTQPTQSGWKCCPYCGYKFEEVAPQDATLDDALGNLMGFVNEQQAAEEKLRALIIRGKYDEAKEICEARLDKNPLDKHAYLGLIRIASKNYTEYDSRVIEEQIRVAEQIFGIAGALSFDSEYVQYSADRKKYFDDKEQRRIEAEQAEIERRHREEEEKAERERKYKDEERIQAERERMLEPFYYDFSGGQFAISGVKDKWIRHVVIPDFVTSVKDEAFKDCGDLKIVEMVGVKSIGIKAFCGCVGLTGIKFGNSLEHINQEAFYNCKSLTGVEFPNSLTNIGHNAFFGCDSLSHIDTPSNMTSLMGAFRGCSGLKSITISKNVTNIIGDDLSECDNLTRITVAEGNAKYHSSGNCIIDTISKTLVAGCKASVIPSDGSVTSIGDCAFCDRKSLTNIAIPGSVRSIGVQAFMYCEGLTDVTTSNGIVIIGREAFDHCGNLRSISIPNSVTTIEKVRFGRAVN